MPHMIMWLLNCCARLLHVHHAVLALACSYWLSVSSPQLQGICTCMHAAANVRWHVLQSAKVCGY